MSARAIGVMLESNCGLDYLCLNCNFTINADGIREIMRGLWSNTSLLRIGLPDSLQGCQMGDFADMLDNNGTLQVLSLDGNTIVHDETFERFAASVANSQSLVRLELMHCDLETSGVRHLFDCLHGQHSLTHLDFESNSIDSGIAESIGKLLRHNTTLLNLCVHNNRVGSRTAVAVAAAMLENTTLLMLEMGDNEIDDEGILAFSRNIQMMKGLRNLDLSGNETTSKGGAALITAMRESRTLISLRISSLTFKCTPRMRQEIDFYARRNEIGWQALESSTPFNEALRPHVLAKVSSDPSMLYFFISEAATIVSHANLQRTPE